MLLVSAIGSTREARADVLQIETLEQGSWSNAVAALQTERSSQGHVVHVVVRDDKAGLLNCGSYTLALDAAASEAFTSDGCDETTHATALRLTKRAALFEHGDVVSKPRTVHVMATRTVTGTAAGGAHASAESAVLCSAEVHPFLRDLENGGRVELTPGRYRLRAEGDDVRVTPLDRGWRLTAPRGNGASIAFEVSDDERGGGALLRDRVSMRCEADAGNTPPMTADDNRAALDAPIGVDFMRGASPAAHEWDGKAWGVDAFAGVALARTASMSFGNAAGAANGGSFGLGDVPMATAGVAAVFERPGLYTSLGGAVGVGADATRTLVRVAATSTIAAALHLGALTTYLGPHVELGTYQLSGAQSGIFEWGTPANAGLGGAAGCRWHLGGAGAGFVLGTEVVVPLVGALPWFASATLGLAKFD
jgi:hypothetical protein